MPEPTDEQTMIAAAGGDLGAFERLVLKYQDEAWRVAYRFCGSAAEAEDMAQEAFLRVLDSAARYRPTASFRTYLFRILTRLCIDWHRKKKPSPIESLPLPAGDAPTPLEQAGATERDAAIQAAYSALPASYRMVMALRYVEELSGAETAEAMGLSVKAVERLAARARSALQRRLERNGISLD